MKIFMNKSIWKKIVIAILIVFAFQAVVVKPVQADVIEAAGILVSPILSLVVRLADGLNDIIARNIMGAHSTLFVIDTDSNWWDSIKVFVAFVIAAAIALVVIVGTAGIGAIVASVVGITSTVTIGMGTVVTVLGAGLVGAVWYSDACLPDKISLPMYVYSAEEIFKGNILLYDINYFKDSPKIHEGYNAEGEVKEYYYWDYDHLDEDGNPKKVITSNQNTAVILKGIVSSWYKALRNICIVLMLSILVYIGIRIILSSAASDKAKYLAMLKDWFIGLCLLFFMHYIMAFSVTIVEKLTDVVKTAVDESAYTVTLEDKDGKIKDAVKEKLDLEDVDQYFKEEGGTTYFTWPTNLMGKLRLEAQMVEYGANYVGYVICFFILVLFTLYFTVIYMKRVLHMAFLTIIAPMVALTYCIDKLNDGKAQGFDRWFKEYIFNLLIQPMHLLLYYILVTSAIELAVTNTIYSIVALAFMLPAEKLLRSLFGFEKAQTAPVLGPAGAMLASSALNNFLNRNKKTNGGAGSKDNDTTPDKPPITTGYPGEEESIIGGAPEEEEEETPIRGIGAIGGMGGTPRTGTPIGAPTEEDDEDEDDEDEEEGTGVPIGAATTSTRGAGAPGAPGTAGSSTSGASGASGGSGSTGGSTSRYTSPKRAGAWDRIKRMRDASWAAQKAAVKSTPTRIRGWAANTHPMKRAGKIVAGAAAGAVAGTLGMAIAASTGDLSNVPKIGLGSAAAGYAFGAGRAEAMKTPMDNPDVKAVYEAERNKGKYKQAAMDDYVEKYLRDVKNQHYFEQKFGKAEAKKMKDRGNIIERCLYSGITEQKDIAATHQLMQNDSSLKYEDAIETAKMAQVIGDPDTLGN